MTRSSLPWLFVALPMLLIVVPQLSRGAETPTPSQPASTGAADPGRTAYAQRCASCHGATGAGDGLGAIGIIPRPRMLRDPAWQASITDAELGAIIVKGGTAAGKSAMMAPNPDLANQPGLLTALVRYVRSLADKPSPPAEKQ